MAIPPSTTADPVLPGHALQQYWRLAETACNIGTWRWDPETDAFACSTPAAALLGLPGTGAVTREQFLARFDPADRDAVALAIGAALAGRDATVDAMPAGPDGHVGQLRLVGSIAPVAAGQPRHVLGLLFPTPRGDAHNAPNRLLRAIVASSDDAIISKTVGGIITSWNPGAERIFGYAAEEIIGQPIAILAVPGLENEMPSILDRLRAGEKIDHYETTRIHKNGSVLHISLTVSPIYDDAGRMIGASKVARDITAARAAEVALRDAEKRLWEQHQELVHVARLSELGQMAATLGHEVNQPLTAIGNYLRAGQRLLAADDPANRPKIEEAIRRAADQALRAGEIIRRLRTLARRGESDPRPEPIAVIIEEATSLAEIEARQRGVHVQVEPDQSGQQVMADRVQIQQVLLNLIRNAVEAMDGQTQREVLVTTAVLADTVEVSVADTGPGLPAQVRDKLFQPFVTTKSSGMGIGLSICQKIIQSHDGRLWVEANPGGGTIFKFTLRLTPPT
ncbi:MAG: PAS domain S-box protein [Acetobacteraceae bacterium]|nr:PAS domain S-box protein [Acetobacteraceae bacterium]